MPSFIMKPSPDEDWYVVWSTITDCPTAWGSRLELLDSGSEIVNSKRLDRADEYGSSEFWGRDGEPMHSWSAMEADPTMILGSGNAGVSRPSANYYAELRVDRIREFCERWDLGQDRSDLVDWSEHDDE